LAIRQDDRLQPEQGGSAGFPCGEIDGVGLGRVRPTELKKHAGRINDSNAGLDTALGSGANTRLARSGGVRAVEGWNHTHGKLSMRHGDASDATFRRMTSLSTMDGRRCPLSGNDAMTTSDRPPRALGGHILSANSKDWLTSSQNDVALQHKLVHCGSGA
jgi:hypothetical protein